MALGGAMLISTLLSDRPVITISPTASIAQLTALLAQHGIGAVIVSGDGKTINGIVSERDIVRGLHTGNSILHEPVSSIMTSQVYCALPDSTVDQLMHVMTERRIRHIPIVDGEGALIDIVSIGDVVRSRLDQLEGEREALMEYITKGG
jgi:CBS domain-containing protein